MTPPAPELPQPTLTPLGSGHGGGMVWLRNKFLAGLALALPLVITFAILQFVYALLHGWSEPIVKWFADLANEMAGRVIIGTNDPNFILATRFIGVLIPLLALIALGVMATNVIGVHVVAAIDRLLLRIPFVSFIYKSLKQVIDSFKTLGGHQNFKRVAYIDYPVPGMRMLGFVTGQFTDPATGKALTTVFVPTVPNPMSGILLVVDSEKVTDAAITLEDSMKLIFSAGLIGPDVGVAPLNQRAPVPQPAIEELDGPIELPVAEEPPPERVPEQPLFSLPRAEDFDSGDPDILADAERHAPRLSATQRVTNRIADVLTWKRR
jgi:uncharacterized membrane protein